MSAAQRAVERGEASQPPSAQTKLVGAVAAAARVLSYLAAADEPAGATQIARALGINVSTCFQILRTLVHFDLVAMDEVAKTYRLDLGIVDLARGVFERDGLLGVARPRMQRLAQSFNVTVSIWQRTSDEHLVLVGLAESPALMRIYMPIGSRIPLLIGAGGRAMVAHLPFSEAELEARFARLRWAAPLSFADYLAQVDNARVRGYAIDSGTYMPGVMTLSAPIFATGSRSNPTMALTTVLFLGQHPPEVVDKIGEETKALADLLGTATLVAGTDRLLSS